mmetsp:Transcript_17684/g.41152  ORF Transcript_17684/g.41152 Transcript_17684/m.41152 type:complete len:221 (+) Transcript_17684:53-715(+)
MPAPVSAPPVSAPSVVTGQLLPLGRGVSANVLKALPDVIERRRSGEVSAPTGRWIARRGMLAVARPPPPRSLPPSPPPLNPAALSFPSLTNTGLDEIGEVGTLARLWPKSRLLLELGGGSGGDIRVCVDLGRSRSELLRNILMAGCESISISPMCSAAGGRGGRSRSGGGLDAICRILYPMSRIAKCVESGLESPQGERGEKSWWRRSAVGLSDAVFPET